MKTNPFCISQERKEKPEPVELAGGLLPRQLADRLTLWAVYLQVSKSQLIRKAVSSLLPCDKPAEEILQALAEKAYKYWIDQNKMQQRKIKGGSLEDSFIEYKTELYRSLQGRGVRTGHIKKILEILSKKVGFDG